jgi:hypothetical protein
VVHCGCRVIRPLRAVNLSGGGADVLFEGEGIRGEGFREGGGGDFGRRIPGERA